MRTYFHPVVFVLERLQRRFARSRPGSVLILTVVLVVLLALLGTALLSTTRVDRYTATQNTANTQIDLLMEGVKELAKAAIRAGVYGTTAAGGQVSYRPAADTSIATAVGPNTAGEYRHYDASSILNVGSGTITGVGTILPNDSWLASRTPSLSVTAAAVYWPAISKWLANASFEAPFVTNAQGTVVLNMSRTIDTNISGGSISGGGTFQFRPTSIHPAGFQDTFPAWYGPGVGGPHYYLAGDADGDGIADSCFFKLPVGEIDGVSYFAAVRIIDNNSAINVNTAWSRTADFDFAAQPVDATGSTTFTAGSGSFAGNLGWFRSHVGLQESLLRSVAPGGQSGTFSDVADADPNAHTEMLALNRYRFGYNLNVNSASFTACDKMMMDGSIAPNTGTISNPRTDAVFITQGDAMENQLDRRIRNPGNNQLNTGSIATFRAFSIADASSLAYHFVLTNPGGTPSVLESTFNDAWKLSGGAVNNSTPDSLYRSAANYGTTASAINRIAGQSSYAANQVAAWFDDNFNIDGVIGTVSDPAGTSTGGNWAMTRNTGAYRTLRPYLTTYNPVTNEIPRRELQIGAGTGTGFETMKPFHDDKSDAKTDVNTAQFNELWRAFWCVMAEQVGGSGTPFAEIAPIVQQDLYAGMTYQSGSPFAPVADGTPDQDPTAGSGSAPGHSAARMFRNSIRNIQGIGAAATDLVYFEGKNELLLRAALAATQTEQLRTRGTGNATTVVAHKIQLPVHGVTEPQAVVVCGNAPQPFITEVYAQTDTVFAPPSGAGPNPNGYCAVELYNPYSVPIVLDKDWYLIGVPKGTSAGAGYPLPATTAYPQFRFDETLVPSKSIVVPPHGFVVLENLGDDATHRPPAMGTNESGQISDPQGISQPLPEAQRLQGVPLHKFFNYDMILVRRVVTTIDDTPVNHPELYQAIDSYDFTGLSIVATEAVAWHYVRKAGDANVWTCVYPGRYDGTKSGPRQQGTVEAIAPGSPIGWDPNQQQDPWESAPGPGKDGTGAFLNLGFTNPDATYPRVFTIQLESPDSPGPNAQGAQLRFPFGKFARNGDILQIPYIGAYTIYNSNDPVNGLIEFNSISMDAAFAEDSDQRNDEIVSGARATPEQCYEQIGRFCPMQIVNNDTNGNPQSIIDDYSLTDVAIHRYAWAKKLFDYLTVQAPQNDYLPNVSPIGATSGTEPQPVDNDGDGTFNDGTNGTTPPANNLNSEDVIPVHGLININTAPWRVIAALPMLPMGDHRKWNETGNTWDPDPNTEANIELAKAIVKYRDGDPVAAGAPPAHGPFMSLFDLYRVPAFRQAQHDMVMNLTQGPGKDEGDFSPMTTHDDVRDDFEEYYLMLNRISNLITTRSDSFTVYILVQGWRGIGTTKPELVVQRRAAFIQDRSPLTFSNGALPAATNVPND